MLQPFIKYSNNLKISFIKITSLYSLSNINVNAIRIVNKIKEFLNLH